MKTFSSNIDKVCEITLNGRELRYTLKKTGRRSVGISLDKTGAITVAVPYRVSEASVNELLQKKAHWIFEKLAAIEAAAAGIDSLRAFNDGDSYLYLGKPYTLKLIEDPLLKRPIVRIGEARLEVYYKAPKEAEDIKAALKQLYLAQFLKILEARVRYYSDKIGVIPGRVAVREQKTRWGSCSSRGNLNFNWKLVMAPPEILDYVVVHELCHMKELNHSTSFWNLVRSFCPDYKKNRKWLKENGSKLTIE